MAAVVVVEKVVVMMVMVAVCVKGKRETKAREERATEVGVEEEIAEEEKLHIKHGQAFAVNPSFERGKSSLVRVRTFPITVALRQSPSLPCS